MAVNFLRNENNINIVYIPGTSVVVADGFQAVCPRGERSTIMDGIGTP